MFDILTVVMKSGDRKHHRGAFRYKKGDRIPCLVGRGEMGVFSAMLGKHKYLAGGVRVEMNQIYN